jgi:hypothetical protein
MRIGSKGRAAAMVVTVLAGSLTTFVASAGTAAAGCDIFNYDVVEPLGSTWYVPIATRAGKYNASSSTASLTFTLSTTSTKSTTWSASAGGSVGWGIAKVEAKIGRDVTTSIARGTTVTDPMNVPGKRYGYVEAKAEYHRYAIYQYQMTPKCTGRYIKTYGSLDAIITAPFFSECITTTAGGCTPRP